MYKRILVPLEHTSYDETILGHVRALAKLCGSTLVLVHVADGWVARNIQNLNLRESEEMREDRAYLTEAREDLEGDGFKVEALLAAGDPAQEIAAAAARENCDLIAMATHGHKGLGDIIHGTTANALRHLTEIPILMVRGAKPGK
jgi:nucleotide-binding universal stress UspA family protein